MFVFESYFYLYFQNLDKYNNSRVIEDITILFGQRTAGQRDRLLKQ